MRSTCGPLVAAPRPRAATSTVSSRSFLILHFTFSTWFHLRCLPIFLLQLSLDPSSPTNLPLSSFPHISQNLTFETYFHSFPRSTVKRQTRIRARACSRGTTCKAHASRARRPRTGEGRGREEEGEGQGRGRGAVWSRARGRVGNQKELGGSRAYGSIYI